MKILFVTDLHGRRWKYDRLLELAKRHGVAALVNGGDMLPKEGDLFEQDKLITGYLKNHFEGFNDSGINYLCYLGNDDLKIFDPLFTHNTNIFTYLPVNRDSKRRIGWNLKSHACLAESQTTIAYKNTT